MKAVKRKRPRKSRNAEATRARILAAAIDEFANRGLADARTDDIAARCGVDKRLVYYYFGTKEGLYLAALETAYADLTELERAIDVEHLEPKAAIARLINLKIDFYISNPHFISFLNMENLYKARTLRKSKRLHEFKTPLTHTISRILERGVKAGAFRRGIDPIDLYISICALGFMYFANQHTLKVIFDRDLMSPDNLKKRREAIIDLVLSYLNPANGKVPLPSQTPRPEIEALVF
ncbi:TetR/AcrR family transcriptional regulator [Pseudorhodoplanes sp.]|uniref:TetR/AcrR family transcriptional regulator n=1 Tax=Pseudorhodoplanes sp. TaxID=1934341 RepID=UPI003D14B2C9